MHELFSRTEVDGYFEAQTSMTLVDGKEIKRGQIVDLDSLGLDSYFDDNVSVGGQIKDGMFYWSGTIGSNAEST